MIEIKHFYNTSIIPRLSEDVEMAEEARQAGEHGQVEALCVKWIDQQDLLPTLELRSQTVDLEEERDLIRAGFAGLGRIRHVDANSQLQTNNQNRWQTILESISQVDSLYQQLVIDELPPFSIHGGSLCWPLEIAQDRVNTYTLMGSNKEAERVIFEAIWKATEILENLRGTMDLMTSDDVLKAERYSVWRERKRYLGVLSALGVVEARKGRKDKYLPYLIQGQQHVSEASRYEVNPHRLATVSYWLIACSLDRHYRGALPFRIEGILNGLGGVSLAVATDHKAALSSFRQMVRENT